MKKKVAITLVSVLVLVWLLLPVPMPGQGGGYNPNTEILWCNWHGACVHEVAHKLDDDGGWISHTPEFGEAVYVFTASELIAHDTESQRYKLAHKIMRMPGVISWAGRWLDSQAEIYATIFQAADGKEENMPEIFRPFYDWDATEKLLEKHQKYPSDG